MHTRSATACLAGLVLGLAASAQADPALTTLASFNYTDGANPYDSLIADADGNLYGTTENGGTGAALGTVFMFDRRTNTLTTLAGIGGTSGANPYGGLIAGTDGSLYGTTRYGTIFRLTTTTNTSYTLTTLVTFSRGGSPFDSLIADASGNFYGTTEGMVFKFDPKTNTLTTLASFNGTNGYYCTAGLIADANGDFYGTTVQGGILGQSGNGTIFKVDPRTNTLTSLASFGITSGIHPYAGLIAGADGDFYGTTSAGAYGTLSGNGNSGDGTVFKFDPRTNTLTTVAAFSGANGADPEAGLIVDAAGNLYGTTVGGGAYGAGTIFKLNLDTNTLTTLWSFSGADGANPYAALIADGAGNLYGTTANGGVSTFGSGTIFELTDSGFVVPEPASLALLALPAVALLRRRRRFA